MSQDELDELFGEEIEDSSMLIEKPLVISKLGTSAENELSASENEDAEMDVQVTEMTFPSIKKPSEQGLIVIFLVFSLKF